MKNLIDLKNIEDRLFILEKNLNIDTKIKKIINIEKEISIESFWVNNNKYVDQKLKELSILKKTVNDHNLIKNKIDDLKVLLDFIDNDKNDEFLLLKEFNLIKEKIISFERDVFFTQEDDKNVYLEINSGEGGEDAKDFARMILRMYLKWFDKKKINYSIIEIDYYKNSGINTALVWVRSHNIFGILKGEKGIHRLVRLSPFNSSNKRQTSFVSVNIIPEIEDEKEVILNIKDLRIDTYRSGGSGGQSVNTTDSAVRIKHIPTGIVVTCQNERSQIQNKNHALKILKTRILDLEKNNKKKDETKINIGFGQQIRSYVLHPYKLVKDHRTTYESSNVYRVLDGEIDEILDSTILYKIKRRQKKVI